MSYTDRDISRDEAALTELSDLGYMTTPVTKINGDAVVGCDRKRLEALLG